MSADSPVFAVVMAGGSGTRFWPASRKSKPKQLLAIAPGSEQSLLKNSVRRLLPLCPAERILIATGQHLLQATQQDLPELPAENFLGEPLAKNTAPCIGWATLVAARKNPDAVLVVVPSDHFIQDEAQFIRALEVAIESAKAGFITTLGITPTRPETGYGYIELGEQVEVEPSHQAATGVINTFEVKRFVEKPSLKTAEEYLASGAFVWNAGIFVFRARDMLAAMQNYLPELYQGLMRIEQAAAAGAGAEAQVVREVFEGLSGISIDYGIMERVERLHVVPASFGWSDLGSWESAWELGERDAEGNLAPQHGVLVDSSGCLVVDLRSGQRELGVIALVGVTGLCVVQTDDALLIIPREKAQQVRDVVEALQAGRRDHLL